MSCDKKPRLSSQQYRRSLQSGSTIHKYTQEHKTTESTEASDDSSFPLSLNSFSFTPKILGEGTFGKVHLVIHRKTGKYFALKVVSKSIGMLKQVRSEIEIHGQLDHPNIAKLLGYFEDNSSLYILLEYAAFGSLFQYIGKSGDLSEKECKNVFLQVCCGIYYLHKRGLIHRDLKPENILIDKDKNVKISDFGWSVQSEEIRKTFCGTFDFMAPEMVTRAGHSFEVDIWALGALLYELFHGTAPFQTYTNIDKYKHICEADYAMSDKVGTHAQDLIQKLLVKDPKQRLSIEQVLEHPWFYCNYHTGHQFEHKALGPGTVLDVQGAILTVTIDNSILKIPAIELERACKDQEITERPKDSYSSDKKEPSTVTNSEKSSENASSSNKKSTKNPIITKFAMPKRFNQKFTLASDLSDRNSKLAVIRKESEEEKKKTLENSSNRILEKDTLQHSSNIKTLENDDTHELVENNGTRQKLNKKLTERRKKKSRNSLSPSGNSSFWSHCFGCVDRY